MAADAEIGVRRLRAALELPFRYRRRFRAVITAIEGVHGVPPLNPIPVILTKTESHDGGYRKCGGTGKPLGIEISRLGETIELTFAHEIGHFLEGVAIPGASFGIRAWNSVDCTTAWREAVLASRPVQALGEILERGTISVLNSDGIHENREANKTYVTYLRDEGELWARSYAQYIAVRSGNATLWDQVGVCRSPAFPYPLQWAEDEFEPIAGEFDSLFRKIGWRP